MAIPEAGGFATFDDSTGVLDIAPVLASVLLKDKATLGLLGLGPAARRIVHYWNSDSLNAKTVVSNEGGQLSAAATSLTVVDASKIRVGTLLSDKAAGKNEVVQVTAISTNTLTITRAYGESAEVHAADAEWLIVGQPTQQGDETVTDISNAPTQDYNHVQNFKRTVKIAEETIIESRNGAFPGLNDYFQRQLMKRIMEMEVEMNATALLGIRSGTPSDSVISTLAGLRAQITASGGNVTLAAGGDLSDEMVNDTFKLAWDDGGQPGWIIGNRQQTAKFARFHADKVRIAASEQRTGLFVRKFLTDTGHEMEIFVDRDMPIDELCFLDKAGQAEDVEGAVYIAPLMGGEMRVEPLAKAGNAEKAMVTSRWTLVVQNATKAHAWIKGLKV